MAQRLNINKLFFCHGAELALLLSLIGLFPTQSFGGEFVYEQLVMLARSGNYQPLLDSLKQQQMQGGLATKRLPTGCRCPPGPGGMKKWSASGSVSSSGFRFPSGA